MYKYKVGDRVLYGVNDYIVNGVIHGNHIVNFNHYYLIRCDDGFLVSGIREALIKLDIQYYREQRLKGLLD